MPWHSLTNLTTVKSLDMRDNFDVIGAGSRLPMSPEGAAFANTTGVYDIGSSAYRWNDIFATNLDITGSITTDNGSLEVLIAETTLSATASNIEFTGLNGDTDVIYFLRAFIHAATTTNYIVYGLIFNGDSATNYGIQTLAGRNVTPSAIRGTGQNYIEYNITGYDTTTSIEAWNEMIIYAKTGNERLTIDKHSWGGGTLISDIALYGGIWNNTTSTITSIKIYGSAVNAMGAGTNIQLWARR